MAFSGRQGRPVVFVVQYDYNFFVGHRRFLSSAATRVMIQSTEFTFGPYEVWTQVYCLALTNNLTSFRNLWRKKS